MKRPIDATTLRAEFTGNFNGGYYTVAEIKAIIDTAPTLDKDINVPGKWISVADGLPGPISARNRRAVKPVLLYSPKGGVYVGWYFGKDWYGHDKFINRTSRDSSQYITSKVTHWMPLPPEPEVSE